MKFTANRVSHLFRFVDLCDQVERSLSLSLSVSLSILRPSARPSLSLSPSTAPSPSFPPLSFKKVSTTIAFTRYLLIVTALLRRHKSAVYDRLSGHDGVRGIPPGLLPSMRLYDVVVHVYIYIHKKNLCWLEDGKNNIMIEEDAYSRWQKSSKMIEMSIMIFLSFVQNV